MRPCPRRIIEVEIIVCRFQASKAEQLSLGNHQLNNAIWFGDMYPSDNAVNQVKKMKRLKCILFTSIRSI